MIIILITALMLMWGLLICLSALEHWSGPFSTMLMVATALIGLVLALVIDALNFVESRLRRWLSRLEEANR